MQKAFKALSRGYETVTQETSVLVTSLDIVFPMKGYKQRVQPWQNNLEIKRLNWGTIGICKWLSRDNTATTLWKKKRFKHNEIKLLHLMTPNIFLIIIQRKLLSPLVFSMMTKCSKSTDHKWKHFNDRTRMETSAAEVVIPTHTRTGVILLPPQTLGFGVFTPHLPLNRKSNFK